MNNIGNKIRKIRELKNIPQKDMADRMDMSLPGYSKIERDEVSVSIDRLLQVSEIFGMKPEEVLTFDEKMVFNNYGEIKGGLQGNNNVVQHFPDEMKRLYEENVKLLQEKIAFLEEKVKWLEGKK